MKSIHLNFNLSSITRLTLGLLVVGALTFLSSCGDDDDDNMDDNMDDPQTIVDVAIASGYSRLAEALTEAGLVTTLQGDGPFTVFAPTNAAFEAAGVTSENNFGGLSAMELANVLTYHVVPGSITSDQLTTGDVETVQSETIAIDASALTVNGVSIINPFDVEASNGVIHTIGSVLTPPSLQPMSLSVTAADAGLTTLLAATDAAQLTSVLEGSTSITVFAPDNDAFADLLTALDVADLTELIDLLGATRVADILQYHVVATTAFAADLTDGQTLTTLAGQTLTANVAGDGSVSITDVSGNTFNVTTADVEITNGVVHVIDGVLISTPTLSDVIVANDLSTLLAATDALELTSTLVDAAEITVFAPTNTAFANLLTALDVADLNELVAALGADRVSNILQYHVVGSKALSGDLSDGQVLTTLAGQDLTVNVDGGNVTISDVSGNTYAVSTPDLETTNGVVHIIDGVLLSTPTIADVAIANNLNVLLKALEIADLTQTLLDQQSMTVFAPTDAAFTALLGVIGQSSLEDIPVNVITRLLQYHVVSGAELVSSGLSDGATATTLLMEDITVGVSGSNVSINGSNVSIPDVFITNGVVHVIDDVLVPALEASIVNTVVEPAYFNVNFTVLTDAVVTAGLLGTLIDSQEEWTVFAPTNDAFAAAGITSLEGLTANDLVPILQYHVLDGAVEKAQLPATGSAVPTLNGDFYLSINNDGVFINGLTEVIATDIAADNGVVHVIDRTLLPASQDIVDIAVGLSTANEGAEFTQLVAALTAVENDANSPDLITALKGDGPFTVFAPTDAAFEALYAAVGDQDADQDTDINDLVAAVGLPTIATVLQYHVLSGRVFSTDIPNVLDGANSVTLTPLAGGDFTLNSTLTITAADAALSLGLADAAIVDTDVLGTNGVIHVINQVILP